ncbi:MAG: VWA domain-containing protein [Sandaracinus sp.]|nr:VWA domain-containing protein [Sandaracinus sp.]MCB9635026.1 VWA domain-containing protein [Sandaracinus sp.]
MTELFRFAQPLALAVALPLLALLVWRVARLPRFFGRRHRAIQVVMITAGVCVTLALAGLELGHRLDRLAVVFVLDRSRSVDEGRLGERSGDAARAAVSAIRDAVPTMEPGDQAGLVIFGANATTELLPSPEPPIGTPRASVPRDASDLGAGIRRALADLPAEHTGRVVVISDGVENRGDALAAATLAAGRGVVVDVLPIEREPRPEVAVESVRLPRTARPGEPVELRVVTRATVATRARVRVMRGGAPIAEAEVDLRPGSDVLVLRDEAPDSGVHRYDVLVDPLDEGVDSGRDNNEGGAFLRVLGGSRVLVAGDAPEENEALVRAIREGGLEVATADARTFPTDLGELATYDLVVLADLQARGLTEEQMLALSSYVRDLGGGLLMAGARRSFGLGGWAYTPVEEALPARFDLRQRRDRLSLAMIVAIDKSGSMTIEAVPGRTKLDLANEAAARSAMLLSPADRVGVMHVDTAVTWTQPMVSVTDPNAIAAACRAAQPGGGGIDVDVAMPAAYAELRAERTQLKHFLLFADGDDSQGLAGMREVVAASVRDRITTSIVSMGAGPYTPELEHLSRMGGGRFYIVDDLTQLPRIFTQETMEASRAALVEEPFRPEARFPGAATRGLDFSRAPSLGGYAVVNARSRASELLAASDEDPLLVQWQHGVGRSAVFATDVGAELARSWLSWPGYSVLFDQLARDLARSPERRDARVSLEVRGGVGHVRVEAVSAGGEYRNYLQLGGTVAASGGRSVNVDLRQTGAGRYEGTFDADAPGPYLVTVREGEGDEAAMVGSAGVVQPRGGELRGEGTNHALLGQVAALTGGHVREDLTDVFSDRPPPTYSYQPLWPYLLATALVLFLLSVALRRLVLPANLFRRRKARPAGARVTTPASHPTLDTRTAKTRERRDGDEPEELRAVREGKPASGASTPKREDPPPPGGDDPPPPAAPGSLAEQLLAKKKKR